MAVVYAQATTNGGGPFYILEIEDGIQFTVIAESQGSTQATAIVDALNNAE